MPPITRIISRRRSLKETDLQPGRTTLVWVTPTEVPGVVTNHNGDRVVVKLLAPEMETLIVPIIPRGESPRLFLLEKEDLSAPYLAGLKAHLGRRKAELRAQLRNLEHDLLTLGEFLPEEADPLTAIPRPPRQA